MRTDKETVLINGKESMVILVILSLNFSII